MYVFHYKHPGLDLLMIRSHLSFGIHVYDSCSEYFRCNQFSSDLGLFETKCLFSDSTAYYSAIAKNTVYNFKSLFWLEE